MKPRRKQGLAPSVTSILSTCTERGECRLWQGAFSANGYPYVYDGRDYAAGRLASGQRVNGMRSGRTLMWELARGPVPEGKNRIVLSCGNKACLAPAHLLAMSHGEAARLAAERGAYKTARHKVASTVTARRNAKLTPDKAELIRHRVLVNEEPRAQVAESLNVCRSLVDQIIRGDRWNVQMAPNASVFHQRA